MKKTPTKTKSPALQLVELVYQNQGHQMGRSRERFHDGVRAAVRLAIRFGLRFDIDDVAALAKQQTQSYHNTSIYACGEREYALACGEDRGRFNKSAVLSFENWKNRKPFNVRQPEMTTPIRVYEGLDFLWYGERHKCTSFADDSSYLVACTYKANEKDDDYARKIDRRAKISHDDIKEYHATLDLHAELIERVKTLPLETTKAITERARERWPDRDTTKLALKELKEVHAWIEAESVAA